MTLKSISDSARERIALAAFDALTSGEPTAEFCGMKIHESCAVPSGEIWAKSAGKLYWVRIPHKGKVK